MCRHTQLFFYLGQGVGIGFPEVQALGNTLRGDKNFLVVFPLQGAFCRAADQLKSPLRTLCLAQNSFKLWSGKLVLGNQLINKHIHILTVQVSTGLIVSQRKRYWRAGQSRSKQARANKRA